ncbi:MAG: flagellar protein FlaG [Caulobacter sp.]|jgi:flagellar protein FlaG|nr:flagellar protein FlaG [Caulobacter sp.]
MKAIAPTSAIQDTGAFPAPKVERVGAARSSKQPAQQTADLRLIIEEDEATGTIVYKTLDRRTGEVVRQLPREEVLRLKDELSYQPGDVVDSRS